MKAEKYLIEWWSYFWGLLWKNSIFKNLSIIFDRADIIKVYYISCKLHQKMALSKNIPFWKLCEIEVENEKVFKKISSHLISTLKNVSES